MRSKKAMYNISTNLLLEAVIIVYSLIVPKIIISYFGSEVNGLLSSITEFLAYISLLEAGVGPVVKAALYKPIAEKNSKEIANILYASEKFFRTIAIIFICYLLVICMVFPYTIAQNFNAVYTISLIIILAVSTFAEYFFGMTYRLYIQAEQNTYIISLIQILTYILSIILIMIIVRIFPNVHLLKLLTSLIFLLRPILQNYYVKKKYKINLKNSDKNYKLKNKWDGLVQHIAYIIHSKTDIIVISIFCNLKEVSVYSVYSLVVLGLNKLISSFANGVISLFGDMMAKNEKENINEKFGIYEVFYFTLITIFYSSALVLIIPFVQVYTKGITDINYVRPLFGILLVICEYIYNIRLPYSLLIQTAGHFKETKKGAWVEAMANIAITLILINKYGIVGAAIGTLIAMTIRTIEFIYHTNKYILDRSILVSVQKIILLILETLIITLISKIVPMVDNTTYLQWIVNGTIIFLLSVIIILIINGLFYRTSFIKILKILKKTIKKRR